MIKKIITFSDILELTNIKIKGACMNLNTHETQAWWLERMLDKSIMATSYKLFWFKGIFDLICHQKNKLFPLMK